MCMGVGGYGPQEGGQFPGSDVSIVLGLFALQEALQTIKRIVNRPASDSGQVVYLYCMSGVPGSSAR